MDSNHQRDRRVAADMARVFGTPAPVDDRPVESAAVAMDPVAPVAATAAPIETAAARPERARRWLLLAAPALAILFVAVLAVRFALTLVPAADTGNMAAPATARPTPSAYIAAAPRVTDSNDGEVAVETLAADDFGPAPVIEDRPAASTDRARAVPAVADDVPPVVAERPARRGRRAEDCPPGSDSDRCIYSDVIGADRRLRAAYAEATRAGVRRDDLVDVRRRWDRARAISLDEPDETIRRYGRLTERLDELSSMAQQ